MVQIYAKGHKLNKPEDGNYGKNHNYICDQHKIEEAFRPGFFNPLKNNLLPGDTIRVIEMGKFNGLPIATAVCEGIVTFIKGNEVYVEPLTSKARLFQPPKEEKKELENPKPKIEPGPQYVKGHAQVEWHVETLTFDVMEEGKIVASTSDKAKAHAIARGDIPIPDLSDDKMFS